MTSFRYDDSCQTERRGIVDDGFAVIYPTVFDRLCRAEGYSKKSFISWAAKKDIIQVDAKGNPKVRKIDGKSVRAIALRLDNGITVDEDGFIKIDEYLQQELPFS